MDIDVEKFADNVECTLDEYNNSVIITNGKDGKQKYTNIIKVEGEKGTWGGEDEILLTDDSFFGVTEEVHIDEHTIVNGIKASDFSDM